MPMIHILPADIFQEVSEGTSVMEALRSAGIMLDAPCGGNGKCGKCTVIINGTEALACQTRIEDDTQILIPKEKDLHVMRAGIETEGRVDPLCPGMLLAIDIGTTSVVCFLLDGANGREIASASALNPQIAYGADVITRIREALAGKLEAQRDVIRQKLTELIQEVCRQAEIEPSQVGLVSVVGNPAMQQLFLGISPQNLVTIPFGPVLNEAETVSCRDILPICENAQLLIVPDISGYVGADTMGCVLSTRLYDADELTLMVDIGTNGEMVLGDKERMIACSTAAGPALEGANILFGMRGTDGAIDHVKNENGEFSCSVIGGGKAEGICGSGLIDAVAASLDAGMINKRGRIISTDEIDGQRFIPLCDGVYLNQEDIRQVQMAKGAICAGVQLMAKQLGKEVLDIKHVLLAGAFGSFMDPDSACRIGLLPEELQGRIVAVGNAAGSGAKLMARDKAEISRSQKLKEKIEFLELASLKEFSGTFARAMNFREAQK